LNISEVDATLDVVRNRTSFFTKDEVCEYLGDEWATENPAFNDIYSLSKVIDALLERRLELMEGENLDGELQEELDALTGTDFNVG